MGITPIDEVAACPRCRSAVDTDQRYCLQCGSRLGAPRVDFLGALGLGAEAAPIAPVPPAAPPRRRIPSRSITAGLAAAVLLAGTAVGASIGPAPTATADPAVVPLSALVPPAPAAPLPAVAEPAADELVDAGTSSPAPAADPVVTADSGSGPSGITPAPATTPAKKPSGGGTKKPAPTPAPAKPPIDHVWVISLTGQDAATAFGPASPAPYLAKDLAAGGTVLNDVLPVGPTSIAGGVALLSGQGPNAATSAGCATYADVLPATVSAKTGLAAGTGCVYPAAAKTLADQLATTGKTWRSYAEDAGTTCRRPELGGPDPWQAPATGDAFLTSRNPFVYFHSIIDAPACAANVLGLDALSGDLADPARTPSLSWIVPNACHDGRDAPCADGAPAGLAAADGWLRTVVPQITATEAYAKGGLIAITFDAAAPGGDPNAPRPTGTLLLSPFVHHGRTVAAPSTPYALLRSIEDLFSLQHLGHADDPNVATFDDAIYITTT